MGCCLHGSQSPSKYLGVYLNYLEGKGSSSVWLVDTAIQFPSQARLRGSNIWIGLKGVSLWSPAAQLLLSEPNLHG